ncbi:hypothetical protein SETIT_8G061000v2 [Setaria italica]|uniref:Uncharacterized protein n=1 Tax=Setaria italica TaxID=4555 RepID=K3ZND0_SETIT|nr:uncharacterized protein LOC101762400 isoform X1 [Setaria italica]RCV37419.1 hypothetical protein SETIT_8G061000v2 [Setaria italica]
MAETVGSAVMGETVSTIISSISRKTEEKIDLLENIERLEIAHIKLEAALDMSKKWQISSIPLLRWRRKLKLAAQECNNVLRQSKQRAIEEEDIRQRMSQSSFPKRIAHATKSLVSSFIPFGKDEPPTISSSDIQRFERFADGANEFLKFVEFGGTPRQYMFSDPLIGHLLTGKSVRYQVVQGSKLSYFGIRPMNFAERGVEAMIGFIVVDFKDPMKGLILSFILRLSDSTDIFGVMIKCMQSVTPHYKFVAEHVKRELIQLPTQEFSFLLHSPYVQSDDWSNIHSTLTKWCRPNPLCCNENNFTPCSSTSNTIGSSSSLSPRLLCEAFPEEVIMVLLQCRMLLPDQHRNRQNSATSTDLGGGSSLNPNMHPLKLGILFMPHDSPEDIDPAMESYALEVTDEKEHDTIHTELGLQDLDEKLLPKAIDHLYQNAESKMYQMCLKTRHGTAHLCVEKTTTKMQSARRSTATRQAHSRRVHIQDKRAEQYKQAAGDLLKLRVVRASDKLQGSIRSWAAEQNIP